MASKTKFTSNGKGKKPEINNDALLLNPEAKPEDAVFVNKFYVDFSEVDTEKIFAYPPQMQGEQNKALVSTDMYKVEKDGNSIEEEFAFRGPPLITHFGISQKENEQTGTKNYAIYTTLAGSRDPKQKEFVKFLEKLYDRKAAIAEEHRVRFGLPKFTAAGADEKILRYVKYTKDEATQQVYYDRDPYFASKLVPWFKQRTMFVGLDGKVIPWARLMNVEMCFVGTYTCGYHKGGLGLNFPMKMKEAVVLYYRKVENNSSQEKTIEEYRDKYMEEYRKGLQTIEHSMEKHTLAPSLSSGNDDEGDTTGGTLGKVGSSSSKTSSPPRNLFDKQEEQELKDGQEGNEDGKSESKAEEESESSESNKSERGERVVVATRSKRIIK